MRRNITGAAHEVLMVLNRAGWSDPRIGEALGVSDQAVRRWRKAHGIGTAPRDAHVDYDLVRSMYDAGASDRDIARTVKIAQLNVRKWRNGLGLPPKYAARKAWTDEERRTARALLKKGHSCAQVAEATGRSAKVAQRLRDGIKNKSGLRKVGQTVKGDRERALAQDPEAMWRAIRAVIPPGIPRDLAADIAGDMLLALYDGTLAPTEIKSRGRAFVNEAYGRFASKYGAISLDDGEFGRALIETIEDEGAEAEIENAAWARNEDGL